MIWTEFPEQNRTLKAGANPLTKPLPVAICYHPEFPKTGFFISKWEMTEEEKARQRAKILEVIRDNNWIDIGRESVDNALVNAIMGALQPVFLCVMHTPPPVSLYAGGSSPFEVGYLQADVGPPAVDPKDN